WDVAQGGDAVVIVKVAAEAALISEAGNADDHRVAELALREKLQRAGLAADLVLGVVVIGQILKLGDRQEAEVGRADREAKDGRFVEESVENARGTESLVQACADVINAAALGNVFAEDECFGILFESFVEAAVDQGG